MRHVYLAALVAVAPAGLLGACSSKPDTPNTTAPVETTQVAVTPGVDNVAAASPAQAPTSSRGTAARTIGLDGLGDLRIGEAVPSGGTWAERGAQTSEACRTVSSPDYPGVYAIVTEGKVRRITVGQRSDEKLVEGVGVGTRESEVKKWFPGFRETPHKYAAAPAKYLTAPNAAGGDPALRFEIGQDGKVSLIHVGTAPVLDYVEGCS